MRIVFALCAGLVVTWNAWAVPVSPWAVEVTSFTQGTGANPAYTNSAAVLGPATLVTGTGTWDGPVTLFNPAYADNHLVSLGAGGSIVVRFDEIITDRLGADFTIFGNAGFIDSDWPNGLIGSPAGLFGDDGGVVEVSENGIDWFAVTGAADGLFPAQPWTDTGSTLPASFRKPMPAGLTLADFDGLTFGQAVALYNGSAGGAPFDINGTGLSAVQYVRVTHDGIGGDGNVELDAFVVVPEPSSLLLGGLGILCLALRQPQRTR